MLAYCVFFSPILTSFLFWKLAVAQNRVLGGVVGLRGNDLDQRASTPDAFP